jgi:hypothetical protein
MNRKKDVVADLEARISDFIGELAKRDRDVEQLRGRLAAAEADAEESRAALWVAMGLPPLATVGGGQ